MHAYIYEMSILVNFALNKNDRRSNNMRKISWARRSSPQACCTHEKKEKKKYYVTILCNSLQNNTQNSLQNSLKFSLQNSLQFSLQYSQIMSMALGYLPSLPQVFAYFLRTTKKQNKSFMNNLLNQNDVICFRPDNGKTLNNK